MIEDPRSDSRPPKIVGLVRRQGRVDRRAGDRATTRSDPIEPLTRSHGQTFSAKPCWPNVVPAMHACPLPTLPARGGGSGGGSKKDADAREDGVPAALRGGVSLRGHDDPGDVIRSYRTRASLSESSLGVTDGDGSCGASAQQRRSRALGMRPNCQSRGRVPNWEPA
jgi:hypothetical protein